MATNWLTRYATRVVVRRVVLLILGAALAWAGIGRADAQIGPGGHDVSSCAAYVDGSWCGTREEAIAQAQSLAQAYMNGIPVANRDQYRICSPTYYPKVSAAHPEDMTVSVALRHNDQSCSGSAPTVNYARKSWHGDAACSSGLDPATGLCLADCDAQQPFTSGFTPPNGSFSCSPSGCLVTHYYNGDGTSSALALGNDFRCDVSPSEQAEECETRTGYYWHSTLNVCAPVEPEDCEEGQSAKEGVCQPPEQCPEGMITDQNGLCKPEKNQCPAAQTKAPDGSCIDSPNKCGTGKVSGSDGTCKPDANGDGLADDDVAEEGQEDDQFAGGDDCNAPPTCSGSVIMCGMARIQWRIECNTRKNTNVSGGSCDAVPICTGEKCDALEYAQLIQQWRTTCALTALASEPGDGEGECGADDANCNGQPDWTENPAPNSSEYLGDGTGEPTGDLRKFGEGEAYTFDSSGFGYGVSCPAPPTVEVMGNSITFDTGPFCDWMNLGGWFALLLTSITCCVFIIKA